MININFWFYLYLILLFKKIKCKNIKTDEVIKIRINIKILNI